MKVSLSRIYPNPDQPRKIFDEEKLQDLALSIEEHGLIEPLVVVHRPLSSPATECHGCGFKEGAAAAMFGDGPVGDCTYPGGDCPHKALANQPPEFMIIAGERRWRACHIAGLKQVPVRRLEATDTQIAEIALIENIQREDLKPLEEARAFQRLLDTGHTVNGLCQKLGFKHPWKVNWRINLLNLYDKFQDALDFELITQFEAYEMSRLEAFGDQDLVFQKIRQGELKGQTQVRRFINALIEARKQPALFDLPTPEKQAEVVNRWDKALEAVSKLICSSFSTKDCEILGKVFQGDTEMNIAKIDLISGHLKMIKNAMLENLSTRQAISAINGR